MPENYKKFLVYIVLYAITTSIIYSVFVLTPHVTHQYPLLRKIIIFFASILLTKYFSYMLISPWHDVQVALDRRERLREIHNYRPLVSVMIPAWNEEVGVLHTIKDILRSNYRNVEIVVVNDGSTDNSDTMIRNFIAEYETVHANDTDRMKILYHFKENEGKGAALNTAIALSSGEILISIDADCSVPKTTIGNFVSYFANPKVMAAVGNVKVGNTKSLIGVIQYLEFLFSFYFKKADSVMNTIYIIGGAAGAFRRSTLEQVGGYHTKNITEDIELSVRIQQAGLKIVYAADAVVYTEGASDIKSLMTQRLRWKSGRFQTFAQHRSLFFSFKKGHNKILSWLVLPLAYFGELQLSLELFFLAFLYVYSFMVSDFSSFISGIIVVGSMFFIQMVFDNKSTNKASFYLLMPIGWLLFYVATFVELTALVKSLWIMGRKRELKWQRWQRQGVNS